jgi:hypothetical protein
MENNIIKITFKENIYKNINKLFFEENKDILYYDNSHMNYIYKTTIEEFEYTFYGFYKETYFNIIFDIYNKNFKTTIKNKLTILIDFNWTLKKYNNDISVWVINTSDIDKECLILPIRNKISNSNIDIEDFIKISKLKKLRVKVKNINIIDQNSINIFTYIKSIFNFTNKEI